MSNPASPPEIQEHPALEGRWRRGWKDGLRASHHPAFLAAEVLAATVFAVAAVLRDASPLVSALAGALGLIAVAAVVLGTAAVLAPVRQRNEARHEVSRLYQEAQASQLSITVEFPFAWYFDEGVTRFVVFPVRVTNRDALNRVNLHFSLVLRTVFRGVGKTLVQTLTPERRAGSLPDPLDVGPQSTHNGSSFISRWYLPSGLEFDELGRAVPTENHSLAAHVTDYVSGTTIEVPVPGKWPEDETV